MKASILFSRSDDFEGGVGSVGRSVVELRWLLVVVAGVSVWTIVGPVEEKRNMSRMKE